MPSAIRIVFLGSFDGKILQGDAGTEEMEKPEGIRQIAGEWGRGLTMMSLPFPWSGGSTEDVTLPCKSISITRHLIEVVHVLHRFEASRINTDVNVK